MGRPPSNGGHAFRFTQNKVAERETILQEDDTAMPDRQILEGLVDKFSESPDLRGKIAVQFKQVWNSFQNWRYALRARASESPGQLNLSSMARDDHTNQIRSALQPKSTPTATHIPANIPAAMPTASGMMCSIF